MVSLTLRTDGMRAPGHSREQREILRPMRPMRLISLEVCLQVVYKSFTSVPEFLLAMVVNSLFLLIYFCKVSQACLSVGHQLLAPSLTKTVAHPAFTRCGSGCLEISFHARAHCQVWNVSAHALGCLLTII